MPRLSRLISLLALCLPIGAAALEAPPHPTLIVAEYRGKSVPVVGVDHETPVALIDGKRKKLTGRIPLQTNRVLGFAAARAQLVLGQIANLQIVTATSEIDGERVVGTPGATIGGYVEFQAKITADRDLRDCYVAFVAFDTDFLSGKSDRPDAQIRLRQIPDLPANRAIDVKFATEPFLGDAQRKKTFVLLFSGAEEIFGGGNAIAWQYFQRREQLMHRAALKNWLERNRTTTQAARPSLQFPPVFLAARELPSEVAADLSVDAVGHVTSVEFLPHVPEPAASELSRTLRGWLFLPKLDGGKPVASRVRVPLKF